MKFSSITEAKYFVHNNSDNIFVEEINDNADYCYIFFSSNGICDEEPIEKYIDSLIDKNRYEWHSISNVIKKDRKTGKCIYVRDVYKNFYIHGVSAKADNIEKTIGQLKGIVSGKEWKIVTVGISSGGYMATIAGMALDAVRIYNISGQYDLRSRIPDDYDVFESINPGYGNIIPLLEKYKGVI